MPKYTAHQALLSQHARLLPPVRPSTSSFSSNTEHLLHMGNSHLKHLYLESMKQE